MASRMEVWTRTEAISHLLEATARPWCRWRLQRAPRSLSRKHDYIYIYICALYIHASLQGPTWTSAAVLLTCPCTSEWTCPCTSECLVWNQGPQHLERFKPESMTQPLCELHFCQTASLSLSCSPVLENRFANHVGVLLMYGTFGNDFVRMVGTLVHLGLGGGNKNRSNDSCTF